jgi:hypothetical protein
MSWTFCWAPALDAVLALVAQRAATAGLYEASVRAAEAKAAAVV